MLTLVRAWGAFLAVAGALAIASPAAAADTVGEGLVITDPAAATETAPPPPVADSGAEQADSPPAGAVDPGAPPPPDASGRRGELHVLTSRATSSTPPPARPAGAPASRAATLPFTGVDAGAVALLGLALLAAGTGVRAWALHPEGPKSEPIKDAGAEGVLQHVERPEDDEWRRFAGPSGLLAVLRQPVQ
jgi:hypothetical protein